MVRSKQASIVCMISGIVILLLLGVSFEAAPATLTPSQQPVVWKMYCTTPGPTQPANQMIKQFLAALEERTRGLIKTELYTGGELPIKVTEITEAVRLNTVQLGENGFVTNYIPLTLIPQFPIFVRNVSDMSKLQQVLEPYLEKELDKFGIRYLGWWTWPAQIIFTTTSIKSIDELKGKKIRVSTPPQAEVIKRLGANSVSIPGVEMSVSLQTHVIQGACTAAIAGGTDWADFLRTGVRLPVNWIPSYFIINKKALEALPQEMQEIVVRTGKEYSQKITEMLNSNEMERQKSLQDKQKMNFIDVTPSVLEGLQRDMKSWWVGEAKAKGALTEEVYNKIVTALGY